MKAEEESLITGALICGIVLLLAGVLCLPLLILGFTAERREPGLLILMSLLTALPLIGGALLVNFAVRRKRAERNRFSLDFAMEMMGKKRKEGVRCPFEICGKRTATAFSEMQGLIELWTTYCDACGRKSASLSASEISRLEQGLPLR